VIVVLSEWPVWKRVFWIALIVALAAFWTVAILLGIGWVRGWQSLLGTVLGWL
jgi:hypothetical protein